MSQSQHTELLQTVADLLEIERADQDAQNRERRGRPRSAYGVLQLVAAYDGKRLPTQADFDRVLCHDLSTGGFSFFADHPPRFEKVVVALGAIPFSFVVAKVVRTQPGSPGRGKLLIGCEFVERLST
jgi:hypothetical protein